MGLQVWAIASERETLDKQFLLSWHIGIETTHVWAAGRGEAAEGRTGQHPGAHPGSMNEGEGIITTSFSNRSPRSLSVITRPSQPLLTAQARSETCTVNGWSSIYFWALGRLGHFGGGRVGCPDVGRLIKWARYVRRDLQPMLVAVVGVETEIGDCISVQTSQINLI